MSQPDPGNHWTLPQICKRANSNAFTVCVKIFSGSGYVLSNESNPTFQRFVLAIEYIAASSKGYLLHKSEKKVISFPSCAHILRSMCLMRSKDQGKRFSVCHQIETSSHCSGYNNSKQYNNNNVQKVHKCALNFFAGGKSKKN